MKCFVAHYEMCDPQQQLFQITNLLFSTNSPLIGKYADHFIDIVSLKYFSMLLSFPSCLGATE